VTQTSKARRYSVYRHRVRADLCCAVREGSAEPDFVGGQAWLPAETLDLQTDRPPGFDEGAAAFSCAIQGFYVFYWSFDRRMPLLRRSTASVDPAGHDPRRPSVVPACDPSPCLEVSGVSTVAP
jgi:hypothetical protein